MRAKFASPLLVLAVAFSGPPALAAQRAFVASYGSDASFASGCTLAAPCRAFQVAHDAVDPTGEVVALDGAGYGPIVITKSVTIMANPGVVAGISVSTGNGISIDTAGVSVILRGLNINNVGTGTYGIRMTDGNSLAIEGCLVSRFSVGVSVEAAAKVKVVNSLMRGNGTGMQVSHGASADVAGSQFLDNAGAFGFAVRGAAAGTTSASISDSVASGNLSGFVSSASISGSTTRLSCLRCTASNNVQIGFLNAAGVGATALMLVGSSLASYNQQYGMANLIAGGGGAGALESLGNNALHANGDGQTLGTITSVAGY